jgi:hypothetical protein
LVSVIAVDRSVMRQTIKEELVATRREPPAMEAPTKWLPRTAAKMTSHEMAAPTQADCAIW